MIRAALEVMAWTVAGCVVGLAIFYLASRIFSWFNRRATKLVSGESYLSLLTINPAVKVDIKKGVKGRAAKPFDIEE